MHYICWIQLDWVLTFVKCDTEVAFANVNIFHSRTCVSFCKCYTINTAASGLHSRLFSSSSKMEPSIHLYSLMVWLYMIHIHHFSKKNKIFLKIKFLNCEALILDVNFYKHWPNMFLGYILVQLHYNKVAILNKWHRHLQWCSDTLSPVWD